MPLRQLVQPALLAGSAIFLTLCAPALAEDGAALPAAEGNAARTGGQVYEAEFFARFSPRTARGVTTSARRATRRRLRTSIRRPTCTRSR